MPVNEVNRAELEALKNSPFDVNDVNEALCTISKWPDLAFTKDNRRFLYFECGDSILHRMDALWCDPISRASRKWLRERAGAIVEIRADAEPTTEPDSLTWYFSHDDLARAWFKLHISFQVPFTEEEKGRFEDDYDLEQIKIGALTASKNVAYK